MTLKNGRNSWLRLCCAATMQPRMKLERGMWYFWFFNPNPLNSIILTVKCVWQKDTKNSRLSWLVDSEKKVLKMYCMLTLSRLTTPFSWFLQDGKTCKLQIRIIWHKDSKRHQPPMKEFFQLRRTSEDQPESMAIDRNWILRSKKTTVTRLVRNNSNNQGGWAASPKILKDIFAL